MPVDLTGFVLRLKAAEELIETRMEQLWRKVALDFLTRVTFRTPVDTGRARGNWDVVLDKRGTRRKHKESRKDKQGNDTVNRGLQVISKASFDMNKPVIWVYNNVPYILKLEGGSSQRQAPNGMIALSLAELSALNGGTRE